MRSLVLGGLLLGGLYFSQQVSRRVEVLALVAGATALDVVHAHGDGVVARVNGGAVAGVGKAAVRFATRTVATLELATHLASRHRELKDEGGRTEEERSRSAIF